MAMKARYTVMDGEIVSQTRNGVRHHYVPNPSGSVVALYDTNPATLAKTDTFSYWPYGEEKSRTGTTETPFRFVGSKGYYRESASRTYVRARHFRPNHGRWQTEDLVLDRMMPNRYPYAANSPLSRTDPSGLMPSIKPGCKEESIVKMALDKICRAKNVPSNLQWCVDRFCASSIQIICGSSTCIRNPNIGGYVWGGRMIILCPGNISNPPGVDLGDWYAKIILHEAFHAACRYLDYIPGKDPDKNRYPNPADVAAVRCLNLGIAPIDAYYPKPLR